MRRQYTGLKLDTEAADFTLWSGRGAFYSGRSRRATVGGLDRRANAGMSNERNARNVSAVSLRVPGQRQSSQGQSGAKARPQGVVDAQQVDIPVPPESVITDGVTENGSRSGRWLSRFKVVGREVGKSASHMPES